MGMRRTTRVFGVAKPPDGAARVLRSGRRICLYVDEPKGKRSKGEDFTANKRRKVSTEAEGDEQSVDKRSGIVYNRKRKSLSNQSSSGGSTSTPVKPLQSLKFYSRRRRTLCVVPVITLRVVWSCKEPWLSTVFGLVMRYLRKGQQLSLLSLASFFMSQPVHDVFADHGVRFLLAEPPLSSSRGVCMFFGEMNRLPLLSADFSAIPRCFVAMHLTLALRVASRSFAFVERYLYLPNNPVEECDSESGFVLSPPCSPRNKGGVVAASKLTLGNAQCRSSLGFHSSFQKRRRSSLRTRRARSVHKCNVVTQQNVKVIPIPVVREVCGYADDDSPSFSMPVQYISVKEDEVSRAMARSSAIYDMDSQDEEWLRKQNVEVFGKEDQPLQQDTFELMIDGFEKRHFQSHADDLLYEKATVVASLLYLGRQEVLEAVHDYWLRKRKKRKAPLLRVFQGHHRAKKTPRPSKTVFRKKKSFKRQGKSKQLYLGPVKTAEEEALEEQNAIRRALLDIDDSPSFSMPVAYISVKEDEVSRGMARSSAIYDMDSGDEKWLRKQNVEVFGSVKMSIPLRMESEMMTHTLTHLSDSNSISKVEVVNKKMKKPELEVLAPNWVNGVDVDGLDKPTDSGSGSGSHRERMHRFGSVPSRVNTTTTGSSMSDKSMSKKEVEEVDDDGFQRVGRKYIGDKTMVNKVNVYIDFQTTKLRDFRTAPDVVLNQIDSILGDLPARDGTKYNHSEVTGYFPDSYPNLDDVCRMLNSSGIKTNVYVLRDFVCHKCRPFQPRRPRPPNLRPGKKPPLLEIDMVTDLLWHVMELHENRQTVNPDPEKKQEPYRNTVMLISGDRWLTSTLEATCLAGYNLVTTIPDCMETKPMLMTKPAYWQQRQH